MLLPLGDSALVIRFGDRIDPEIHGRVMSGLAAIERCGLPEITDIVPSYASLTVHYDPARCRNGNNASVPLLPYHRLAMELLKILDGLPESGAAPSPPLRSIEIPVCYGGLYGPDLEAVADHNGMTPEEVIALHSEARYRVYLIGFAPGFPYLGGMPERIAMPRRPSPRPRVPAGSVAIGGAQTGIYPIDSPGGWHIIGRTPLRLFSPERMPPALLFAGDAVRFRCISPEEFAALCESPA
jgi:inhibitor of KinA